MYKIRPEHDANIGPTCARNRLKINPKRPPGGGPDSRSEHGPLFSLKRTVRWIIFGTVFGYKHTPKINAKSDAENNIVVTA